MLTKSFGKEIFRGLTGTFSLQLHTIGLRDGSCGEEMAIAIRGGRKIEGKLTVQGSKNTVLPMMAAALLCDEPCRIENCPDIADVRTMAAVMKKLGAEVSLQNHCLTICAGDSAILADDATDVRIEGNEAKEIRASVLLLGSLLTRKKCLYIDYPGGCSIGSRPVNFHLEAFRKMGVVVREENGIYCEVPDGLHGAVLHLPFPSVGATENILLAAVRAVGTTTIQNAAREPEIVELCYFLKQMGAEIEGIGSACLCIKGKERLFGADWKLGTDRIAFLTYGMMTAGCGGECFLGTGNTKLPVEMAILERLGCEIAVEGDGVWLRQNSRPLSVERICTGPYPNFPTDAQSLLLAVLSKSGGESVVEESVFENRFQMIYQLRKMGANIDFVSNCACVTGVTKLHGAQVRADDLRSGAGLLIAGAMAEGETVVTEEHFIRRGYENVVEEMNKLSLEASWRD